MNKYKTYLAGFLLLAALGVQAQGHIDDVLKSIENNNKSLSANRQLTDAQQLEARTGNYLSNPSVELEKMWGEGKDAGSEYTLTVSQSLDFPTTYARKNKLAELKTTTFDYQFAAFRQQVLLTAKQKCIEIIYLRKQKKLLTERLENAREMCALYDKRLKTGDANQLEVNKVHLEHLNAENQSRLNTAALDAAIEQLQNLNGGQPIDFADTDFQLLPNLEPFEQIYSEFMSLDPGMKNLTGAQQIAEQEVKVNRSLSLPKFGIGYKRGGSSDGAASNGFAIGVSVPLFENKNTVKKAKAQAAFATATLEENQLNLRTNLKQLYQQAEALKHSLDEYAKALKQQRNIQLLNKARDAGQLSVIDYFIEVASIYDSWQTYLDVERNYHDILAQLYQYKL